MRRNVTCIDVARKRLKPQAQDMQALANKRHLDAEVIRRWQSRQSIETISRRTKLGTLYIQAVLRDRFAILPDAPASLKRAA